MLQVKGNQLSANERRSKRSCNNCNQRHYKPIYIKKTESVTTLTSLEGNNVTYPVVVVLTNGIKCRALIDSRAGSS